ncbi:5'-3'_deoxyribonucleotidase [Hexamita inflata]|uniref:5'-3'_deoxyribonucleotidase n=1 Tax=Hexamita inflata TaxID=28002 RepID=A0ABP1JFW6_9EUKA
MTTKNSILFDLDGTLFDYSPTWVPQMNKRYPDINKIIGYPLTEHQLSTRSVLAAQLAQELIYAPRFYVDEQIYDSAYNLVKYLIELGADVWFVTSPVPNYHRKISLISKISQIRRFFGQDISQKIIFSTRKYEVVGKYLIEQLFQQVCGRRLIELRGLFYVINFVETKQCQACQYFHFANNQQNSRKRLQPFNRQITIFVFNIYQNILFVFQITLFIFYKCVCTLLCHFIHQYAFYNTLDTNDILCTNTHICYYIICSRHITHLLLYIHDSVYMLLLLVLQLGLLLVGYNLQFFVVQLQFHILLDLFSFNQLCFQHNPLFQFLYILDAIISSKKTHQLILLTQNKQTSLWSNEYIVLETQYFCKLVYVINSFIIIIVVTNYFRLFSGNTTRTYKFLHLTGLFHKF